ncbi:E3 ubiquitin-protein ligase RNF216 [Alternaria panax]|uniref:E3 ubiquitin-protein ligase RNF216 n=1 Tax=Alternaria panax TaxID=48097 RepID=A0AAD4FAQ2_9PLEO|nr:E3 ubiquitin-protein ligase RNF216 [Alternaria panax]
MAPPGINRDYEVVDLLSGSDTEDEGFTRRDLEDFDARSAMEFAHDYPELDDPIADFRTQYQANDRQFIDLTDIPDVDVPPSDAVMVKYQEPQPEARAADWDEDAAVVSEAACLQMVLSVLPDISVDYVLKLIREKTTDMTRTTAQCEHFLTELLEGEPYPKEIDDAKNKKRKRDDEAENELSTYEKGERDPEIGGYEQDVTELLKDEFLTVPVRHITRVLKEEKTLYKAYGVIERQVRDYTHVAKTFSLINKSRNKRGIQLQLIEQGTKRQKVKDAEMVEEANLKQAVKDNEMGECACCFDDVPLNRMISCNGDIAHFYCVNCPRQQIETQMGQSRCRPKCFGVDDCNGTFTRRQLQQVLSDTTFERLEHMQQREDLEAAGLDFLSECSFCDFKMECLPVEVDKEFRCENPKCGKTSCRLCEKESHIPLSCEEFKKDGQITLRHIVEEAMSAALIRRCNKCKHPFIKELGCNKMTCTHCRNVQCYVCSKNVPDYNHFGEAVAGKCPLHENIEDRHEQEVKRAANEAMAKVRADNPGLSDADLMVKVSDRVKQAEDERKGRATAEAQAFPYHMVGEQLRRAPIVPPMPPMPPMPAFGHPPPANFAPDRARPLDALWNMLPLNPLRNLRNPIGQADEAAQQAHDAAAVGAVDAFYLGHYRDDQNVLGRLIEARYQDAQAAIRLQRQEADRGYLEHRQRQRHIGRRDGPEVELAQIAERRRHVEAQIEALGAAERDRNRALGPAPAPALAPRATRPRGR